MELSEKKVLVFGSGISGISAAGLLGRRGAKVTLYDSNEKLDVETIREELGTGGAADIVLGRFPEGLLRALDLVVVSPGVPMDLEAIQKIQRAGILVIGEVELAYELGRGQVLAITGTNGKTTTTALLGEIMSRVNGSTFVVGNIGNPYTAVVEETKESSVIVAEMSSFQLESIAKFHPKVSAILNLSPDHLNRHHTMEAYIRAKKNIAKNQTKEDVCVLNYEDEVLRKFGQEIEAKVLYFSSRRKLERGVYLKDGKIIFRDAKEHLVCDIKELKLLGTHNYENVMAAVAMAYSCGVEMDEIREAVKQFAGVEHRIEFVAEKGGVAYYNDSKGTNPDAAIKGIQAMVRPTVLIGGGYDKDSSYREWVESFDGKVKKLILLGQTRDKIAKEAKECGFTDIMLADTFEEAVKMSAACAKPGDAVLLSPACASWGMFKNYEERGDKFKEIVNSL